MNRRILIAFLVLVAGLAGPAPTLGQQGLVQAKQAGLIGEKPDGLIGIVDPGTPGHVRALVNQVNAQRRQEYGEIARRRGTTVEQVQRVAGHQLIGRTPSGQFVMTLSGRWTRK